MKTILRWVSASLVGALILGLVGVAGAAPASAATRGFIIVNHTSYTLTLTSATYAQDPGCNGGDEFAPVGTTVAPNQSYRYELVWYLGKHCVAHLSFDDNSGNRVSDVNFRLVVDNYGRPSASASRHPHINVDDRDTGSIVLTDKK